MPGGPVVAWSVPGELGDGLLGAASSIRSLPAAAGIVVTADGGQVASVIAFIFAAGKITEIYILADRFRLTRLGSARRATVTWQDPVIACPLLGRPTSKRDTAARIDSIPARGPGDALPGRRAARKDGGNHNSRRNSPGSSGRV